MAIAELIIRVGDLDEGVRFYTEVCGFRLVRRVPHGRETVAELDAGGQRVTLVAAGAPGVDLALGTDDLAAVRRRLARLKVDGVGEPVELDEAAWLPLTDPWGNRLGFFES